MRWLTLGLIGVVGWSWTSPPDWVRRGNDAFQAGAYVQALDDYAQAVGRHVDPGLVAFNRAAAAYAAGQFDLAHDEYRRTLEDAVELRRIGALYGQGNALAQLGALQRGRVAVATLKNAILAYDACLATTAEDVDAAAEIHADARHNRELALGLLKSKEADLANDPPPPDQDSHQDANNGSDGDERNGQPNDAGNDPRKDAQRKQPGKPENGGQQTDKPNAGKGNLPPLPDDVNGPTLTAEQAQAHLQRNLDRMRQDRLRQASTPTSQRNARDW